MIIYYIRRYDNIEYRHMNMKNNMKQMKQSSLYFYFVQDGRLLPGIFQFGHFSGESNLGIVNFD